MTSIKELLFIVTIMVALGGAIMYETIKSVEHINTQVLRVNKQR
jgi:hypothetical protein